MNHRQKDYPDAAPTGFAVQKALIFTNAMRLAS
jgi:hypothetical protein